MDARSFTSLVLAFLFVDASRAEEKLARYKIDGKVTIQGLKHSGKNNI